VGRATQRRLLFAVGLLGCLTAQAASPVWAIRGAHNTVYLAGSVHLLPAEQSTLPAALMRAYADSSRLVMEIDLGKLDPLQLAGWMTEHGRLPAGTTLSTVIGAQRYDKVMHAVGDLGLPQQALDDQAPWVVAIELTDLEYLKLGFDPEQGVEQQLVQHARSDGKATAGLETVDAELGSLVTLPQADQVRMLDQTLEELNEPPSELTNIVNAWRNGDAPQLANLLAGEYQEFPQLYQALVSERNRRWLPQIEQMLAGSENCLVVVGALHLVGDGGLLELLRRDGFKPVQLD
jgi:uncharacterized protein